MTTLTKAVLAPPVVGRPAIPITDKDLRIIEDMAGRGARLDDIAIVVGVSPSTLDRWLELEEVRSAYQRGRVLATDSVADTLYKTALGGDVTACIFWLKAQAGWNDRPAQEMPTGNQVVFYIPDNGR
jgi:hypothetical protein